jgi:aarF domain-containing kinase
MSTLRSGQTLLRSLTSQVKASLAEEVASMLALEKGASRLGAKHGWKSFTSNATCSTSSSSSAAAAAATSRSMAKMVKKDLAWPELPTALTAIIGTRKQMGFSKGSAALQSLVRASRQKWEEKSLSALNRAYINILSSFSCAPKAQTVIWGLPLLMSLRWQTQASCYSVKPLKGSRAAGKELLQKHTYYSRMLPKGLQLSAHIFLKKLDLTLRAMFLSMLFFPILLGAPLALHFGVGTDLWVQMVRKSLEIAGPAFVKWGQWASTRRDMFPGELCLELSRLYTMVPSHKYCHTKRLVEQAFGQRMEDMFEDFEEEPCASGSIAQVHKAKLSEEGAKRLHMENSQSQTVAVKVRHPDVEMKLLRDFELMLLLADVAAYCADSDIIGESVRQFRGPLIEQLDLSMEAEALCKFNSNFESTKDVSFPKPLYPYVSTDVLVETFEDGVNFNQIFEESTEMGPWNRRLAQMGLNTFFKMLLQDNFVHADLHPGNILIKFKEPDFWAKVKAAFFGYESAMPSPHITLLDTGMSTSLNKQDRTSLFAFFESIASLDGYSIADTSLQMTTIGNDFQFPKKDEFVQEVVDVFKVFRAHMAKYDDLPPASECMSSLLDIFRKHKIGMKSDLSVVIATVFMLEGWATQLDPELKVMRTIRRYTNYNMQNSFENAF